MKEKVFILELNKRQTEGLIAVLRWGIISKVTDPSIIDLLIEAVSVEKGAFKLDKGHVFMIDLILKAGFTCQGKRIKGINAIYFNDIFYKHKFSIWGDYENN